MLSLIIYAYLAVQPIEGPTISQLLYRDKNRKEAFAVIAKALIWIWRAGLSTYDVNFENVVKSDKSGEPMVLDSGEVKTTRDDSHIATEFRLTIARFMDSPVTTFYHTDSRNWIDGYAETILHLVRSDITP